ncbi:hypothetical protein D9M71_242410 [compost metagenome]
MFAGGSHGRHRCARIGQSTEQGQHIERGGGIGRALYAQGGDQRKGTEQGAGDGAGGIGGIQTATGAAKACGRRGQCTHEHGQGTAHQKRWQPHQHKGQQPGQQAHLLTQASERPGGHAQAVSRADAQHGHAQFEHCV